MPTPPALPRDPVATATDRRPRSHTLGLRARAAVASATIALVLSASLAVLAYDQTRNQLLSERERSAGSRTFSNARVLRATLPTGATEALGTLDLAGGRGNTVALVRLASGEWRSGSLGFGQASVPGGLSDIVAAGQAGHQRAIIDDEPYIVVGVPIAAAGARYFEFVPLIDIERSLDGLAIRLAVVASLTTLVGAGVGWYASRRVLRPLRQMSAASVGIADGTLATRLAAEGDPDLEPFVRSFNQMADAVQERIDREVRFTSDVSHEVRSPVAAMLAAISVARRQADDPAAARAALDVLEDRVQAFHLLVVDLLEISRVESGAVVLEREPLEPARLVEAVLDELGHPEVPVVVGPGAPTTVLADRRRLGQMVTNLVTNADRYAGGATRIAIDGHDGLVRFAVEDEGPGVPEHERGYIFERFARGERATGVAGGSGLGLALVREHAKLHGGQVTVEDNDGHGARFVIELPVDGSRSGPTPADGGPA